MKLVEIFVPFLGVSVKFGLFLVEAMDKNPNRLSNSQSPPLCTALRVPQLDCSLPLGLSVMPSITKHALHTMIFVRFVKKGIQNMVSTVEL